MNMSNNNVKIKICGLSRPVDIAYVNEAKPDYCGFIINVPKSIRNTTPDQVRALRADLSDEIVPVGVFRNAPVETVADLLLDGTIAVAQLHGSEDEAYIQRLRSFGNFTIFKAFRAPSAEELQEKPARKTSEEADKTSEEKLSKISGGLSEKKSENSLKIDTGDGQDLEQGQAAREEQSGDAENEADIGIPEVLARWADTVNSSSADMVLLDQGGGGTGKTFDWALARLIRRPYLLAGGIGSDNITAALDRLHPWGVDMSSSVETDGKKDRGKILAAVAKVREWNQRNKLV